MTEKPQTESSPRSHLPWALVPVILLVAMLVGLLSLAAIAMDDPSFAVERDYYKKAVSWDAVQAEAADNDRLGWRIGVSAQAVPHSLQTELKAVITTRSGELLPGAVLEAQAFANARANDIRKLDFKEVSPGEYRALLPAGRRGLWELRFSARHGLDKYSQVVRVELPRTKEGT